VVEVSFILHWAKFFKFKTEQAQNELMTLSIALRNGKTLKSCQPPFYKYQTVPTTQLNSNLIDSFILNSRTSSHILTYESFLLIVLQVYFIMIMIMIMIFI
jgi:hypothetical protein